MIRLRTPRYRRRGFSLVEVATVIAIISILAFISVPSIARMARHSVLESATRSLMGDFSRARSMALSGQQDFPGWTDDERTLQAGLRFVSERRYEVFADKDTESNGTTSEASVHVRDIDGSLEILPPQAEVRFRRNGTLATGPNDIEITIRDTESGRERTVRIAFGGKADIIN